MLPLLLHDCHRANVCPAGTAAWLLTSRVAVQRFAKKAKKELNKGNKLRVYVQFKQGEVDSMSEQAGENLYEVHEQLSDVANWEQEPRMQADKLVAFLAPKQHLKRSKAAAAVPAAAEAAGAATAAAPAAAEGFEEGYTEAEEGSVDNGASWDSLDAAPTAGHYADGGDIDFAEDGGDPAVEEKSAGPDGEAAQASNGSAPHPENVGDESDAELLASNAEDDLLDDLLGFGAEDTGRGRRR